MEDQVQSNLIVKTFPVGPLQCNCTLIGNPNSGQAILIDPGGDSEMLLQELSEYQLQLVEILHTHAHLDQKVSDEIVYYLRSHLSEDGLRRRRAHVSD